MGLTKSVSKRVNRVLNSVRVRIDNWHGSKLSSNFPQFKKAYSLLTDERFNQANRSPKACDAATEKLVANAVDQLRTKGIAVLPGFLNEQEIAAARLEMESLENRWHEIFTDTTQRATEFDAKSGGSFICGNYQQNNRLRVNFHQDKKDLAPQSITDLIGDQRLSEIASRYFDADSPCHYVLAERLGPAPDGDRWHVDRIIDQIKAMVLLTDVEEIHGPLRYKEQTHRDRPEMQEIYHRIFNNGVDEAYPSEQVVDAIDTDTVYGTGKAGDCIVFDTLGIHSGTQCTSEFRQAYVATFAGPTVKTKKLQRWTKQTWI